MLTRVRMNGMPRYLIGTIAAAVDSVVRIRAVGTPFCAGIIDDGTVGATMCYYRRLVIDHIVERDFSYHFWGRWLYCPCS